MNDMIISELNFSNDNKAIIVFNSDQKVSYFSVLLYELDLGYYFNFSKKNPHYTEFSNDKLANHTIIIGNVYINKYAVVTCKILEVKRQSSNEKLFSDAWRDEVVESIYLGENDENRALFFAKVEDIQLFDEDGVPAGKV